MKLLYVGRTYGDTIRDRWRSWAKRSLSFTDQDGFFEASLYACTEVTEVGLNELVHRPQMTSQFDALVINLKSDVPHSEVERNDLLVELCRNITIPKGLFIGSAKPQTMLPDAVLDAFDVIFKREPYRDRQRYEISQKNQEKIVPTMISCPFVSLPRSSWYSQFYSRHLPTVQICKISDAIVDVGFSGAVQSAGTLRQDVWTRTLGEGFSTIGGLQPNPYTREPLSAALSAPRLSGKAYRDALCSARINLALDGIGPYTFRHQELLRVGAFMVSNSTIDELELPMPLQSGVHYVSFDGLDSMVEKIRYYCIHENERVQIANTGHSLFNEYYVPQRHGEVLRAALSA